MTGIVVIFGGRDTEEQAARQVALEAGCMTATATVGSRPVRASNAYFADGFTMDHGNLEDVKGAVIFECSPAVVGKLELVAECDHHNPGDPGFGKGAGQYWEASSLGQLCAILGTPRTHELELVAAGDHCPADAYAGRCPGITPDEFLDFRMELQMSLYRRIASYGNRTHTLSPDMKKASILSAFERAKEKLNTAPIIIRGIRDMRGAGRINMLQDAALSVGEAYMVTVPKLNKKGKLTGNTEITLRGHVTPDRVERFMEWGNLLSHRVADVYGSPLIGFASVLVKSE